MPTPGSPISVIVPEGLFNPTLLPLPEESEGNMCLTGSNSGHRFVWITFLGICLRLFKTSTGQTPALLVIVEGYSFILGAIYKIYLIICILGCVVVQFLYKALGLGVSMFRDVGQSMLVPD